MIELLTWAGYLAAYSTLGFLTGAALVKGKITDRNSPDIILPSLFWPVSLPILAPVLVYKGVKSIRLPSLRRNKQAKFQEIANSPVSILTQLIVQKIQKEPERLSGTRRSGGLVGICSYSWSSSDGKVDVEAADGRDTLKFISLKSVKVDGKEVETEAKHILAALNEAKEFKRQKYLAEQERQRQLTALDAVETLLLSPVEKEK